jgi:hypothetical protein
VNGRGWAVLEKDGTLRGHLFFHDGDDSGFLAERQAPRSKPGKPQPKAVTGQKAKGGKTARVRADRIKSGPIRHEGLPDDLLERLRAIHAAIKDVYSTTLEQFEVGFMRDAHPEREVAIWERIVDAMERVMAAMPTVDKKTVFRTVLGYSMGALTAAQKADPVVKRIIKIADGK